MNTTKIEWTDKTWNPVTGCTKRSSGCANCYAENMARRLCAMGQEKYKNGFQLTVHEDVLDEPLAWENPHTIFVCSMSDLFHEKVPFDYIDKIFDTIRSTPQHKYQILTKRAEIMLEYFSSRSVPDNSWIGVTVENKKVLSRIDALRQIDAKIHFLSVEPLLEDLGEINLTNIQWVIVGGESGPNARPMQEEWVLNIQKQCKEKDVAFFFKQWGTWGADNQKRSKKANGKLLKGKVYQKFPKVA
jgi:protein gp37